LPLSPSRAIELARVEIARWVRGSTAMLAVIESERGEAEHGGGLFGDLTVTGQGYRRQGRCSDQHTGYLYRRIVLVKRKKATTNAHGSINSSARTAFSLS